MKRHRVTIGCVAVLFGVAALVAAYPNGADFSGATGAPGESACACHGNLNSGSGSATIAAPGGYAPGETIDVTVSVAESGKIRWGFAITALDASDNPVGTMMVTDGARTLKTTGGNGREYIKQTSTGTDNGTANGTSWSFQWMAPATDVGPVTFYAAGLACNGTGGSGGDNTYTTSFSMLTTDVSEISVGELPQSFSLSQNYPNPFNPSTTIEFSLPERASVEVAVFDVLGRKIKVLHLGTLSAGAYSTEWDGTNSRGNAVASGIYYYRLQAEGFSETKKMTLVK